MAVRQSSDRSSGVCGDVAEAGADLTLRLGDERRAVEGFAVHRDQRHDQRDVRQRVDHEARPGADGDDQHPCERGTDDAGELEQRAVEAHRVGDVFAIDHLAHERHARGVVERLRHAEAQDEHVDHPELLDVGDDDHPEDTGDQGLDPLRDQEQSTLVDAVGEHAAPRAEHQAGRELECDREPDGEAAVVGEVEHQPTERDGLHPRAHERDALAEEVEAVVAGAQRAERGGCECVSGGHELRFSRLRGCVRAMGAQRRAWRAPRR